MISVIFYKKKNENFTWRFYLGALESYNGQFSLFSKIQTKWLIDESLLLTGLQNDWDMQCFSYLSWDGALRYFGNDCSILKAIMCITELCFCWTKNLQFSCKINKRLYWCSSCWMFVILAKSVDSPASNFIHAVNFWLWIYIGNTVLHDQHIVTDCKSWILIEQKNVLTMEEIMVIISGNIQSSGLLKNMDRYQVVVAITESRHLGWPYSLGSVNLAHIVQFLFYLIKPMCRNAHIYANGRFLSLVAAVISLRA